MKALMTPRPCSRSNTRRRAVRGLTLIELMIAVTIGLFLALFLSNFYLNGSRLFQFQNKVARMQESGRALIEAVKAETQVAGYVGCAKQAQITTPSTGWLGWIKGYDSVAAYNADSVNTSNQISSGNSTLYNDPSSGTYAVSAPVLVVQHGSYQSIAATSTNGAKTVITAGADAYNWAGTAPNLIISDCVKGEVVLASQNAVTVAYNSSTKATTFTFTNPLTNTYDSNARIQPLQTSTFFLAVPAGKTLPWSSNKPSVFQRSQNGIVNQDLRIADNIENWILTYSIGTPATNAVTSSNNLASGVGSNWASVFSVHMNLLMVSDSAVLSANSPYQFNFTAYTGDKFMRKEMATTFAIRNNLTR